MANIDDFKAKLVDGGARPNLFRVTCNFPAYAAGDSELASFMIKGASIPASIISTIEVPFRGRKAKIAGDRTFEPLSLTVLNDSDFKIRSSFEKWMNGIEQHRENQGLGSTDDYQVDLTVEQLDKEDNVTKTYNFIGSFPTNLSQIDLNFETTDTIEEYTVEISYQYWTSDTTS